MFINLLLIDSELMNEMIYINTHIKNYNAVLWKIYWLLGYVFIE